MDAFWGYWHFTYPHLRHPSLHELSFFITVPTLFQTAPLFFNFICPNFAEDWQDYVVLAIEHRDGSSASVNLRIRTNQ